MSSKTQISCARARLSAALELVPRRTVRLFKKSSPPKQQTLSTSSTLKERSVGAQIARAFLWKSLESHNCASVKSLGKERKLLAHWRLSKPVHGARCLEAPDSLERLFLCCAVVLCCFPPLRAFGVLRTERT